MPVVLSDRLSQKGIVHVIDSAGSSAAACRNCDAEAALSLKPSTHCTLNMSSDTPSADKTPTPSVAYTAPTYREDPVDAKVKRKFRGKGASEYYDPCQDAANRSIQCLNRNFGDREMCSDYFQ